MSEKKLDQFFPLDLGWIAKSSQSWAPEDAGPLFFVILYLWENGGRAPDNDRVLGLIARISPKKWRFAKEKVGAFFRYENGEIIQDYLVSLYAEKQAKHLSNSTKAAKGAKAKWEKARSASPSWIAPSTTSSIAPSIPPSDASSNAWDMLRASSYSSLNLDLKREEDSIARPVPEIPVNPSCPEILETLRAYPKVRHLPNGSTTAVRVTESSAHLAAAYLTRYPTYPLALAARYTAKRDKCPKDFENWIADPPAASVVMAAYDAHLKAEAEEKVKKAGIPLVDARVLREEIRNLVDEVNHHAQSQRSLSHA